ncbi:MULTISPECIES: glucose-1-phosphate thymidylyltransferase RfbA [unclassified Nocardiopsis]|uniref:glucose-1-phosphate thymidylyltransferase RfbA n=1 Tax=unclassified Nocardiopsis TaxID=2649073 RepID=UPI0013570AA2
MKGIILAGGNGSRLYPLTNSTSKHLLPVYDKPMVYYPMAVLMEAGIRDILLISTPRDLPQYRLLLGDGNRFGLRIEYAVQAEPNGLAEAFSIGAAFIGTDDVALILGDNLFHGGTLPGILREAVAGLEGCVLFGSEVPDPHRYGVAEVDPSGVLLSVEEKPEHPRSRTAVTGLYLYDNRVLDIAAGIKPSDRGELEITDVNLAYLEEGRARLVDLGPDVLWLDAGTEESLLDAGSRVREIAHRDGVRVACLEEVALRKGYIDADACLALGAGLRGSPYGEYVVRAALRARMRPGAGDG